MLLPDGVLRSLEGESYPNGGGTGLDAPEDCRELVLLELPESDPLLELESELVSAVPDKRLSTLLSSAHVPSTAASALLFGSGCPGGGGDED